MIREKSGDCRVLETEIANIELFSTKFSSEKREVRVEEKQERKCYENVHLWVYKKKSGYLLTESVKRKTKGTNQRQTTTCVELNLSRKTD